MRRCQAWLGSTRTATESPRGSAFSLRHHARDMAHLAAGPHAGFAVEMNGGTGHLQPLAIFLHLVADEVDHLDPAAAYRRCQRPAGDRPHVLLELRNRGAVDGPMAGVVHA